MAENGCLVPFREVIFVGNGLDRSEMGDSWIAPTIYL